MTKKSKKAWDSKLTLALWADRVTKKKAIKYTPFDLVYVIHARLPQHNLIGMYKFSQLYNEDLDDNMKLRFDGLTRLDEERRVARGKNLKLYTQVKYLYDKRTSMRSF